MNKILNLIAAINADTEAEIDRYVEESKSLNERFLKDISSLSTAWAFGLVLAFASGGILILGAII